MDLAYAPAHTLLKLIHRRKLGCVELLDAQIARIERLDPQFNAVVVRDFERARTAARARDRQRHDRGRLHGLPMTVKESFDIAGLPTTWGFPERRGNVAKADALAVSRFKAEGAVIVGKTNVPLALGDWQSFNEVYGTTSNPWATTHTPGGSSGGGAAAVAAGFTALEAGSDIGGSIRQPAHACGIFGHKPTWGLLPMRGHSLAGAAAATDISCIGPLARTARDLALAFETMCGPDPAETTLRLKLKKPPTDRLRGLRIAVWPEQVDRATASYISHALRQLAGALRREGAHVSLAARPALDPDAAFATYMALLAAALAGRAGEHQMHAWRQRAGEFESDDVSAHALFVRGTQMTHTEWLAQNERRYQHRRAWCHFFQDWDVLICPVIATTAFPHDQQGEPWERSIDVDGRTIPYNEMLFWPGLIGGALLPATAVPLGLSAEGLPYGAQIVGAPYADRTTLATAAMLEHTWRAFMPPPLEHG